MTHHDPSRLDNSENLLKEAETLDTIAVISVPAPVAVDADGSLLSPWI
jgi:hypothetical protein